MAAHMLSPLLEYVAISHWSWSYMWPVAQLIRILQQLIIKNRLIIELMIQAFLLVWNLSKHYTVIIYQSAFLWKVRTLEPLKNDTWREINDSVDFFPLKTAIVSQLWTPSEGANLRVTEACLGWSMRTTLLLLFISLTVLLLIFPVLSSNTLLGDSCWSLAVNPDFTELLNLLWLWFDIASESRHAVFHPGNKRLSESMQPWRHESFSEAYSLHYITSIWHDWQTDS